MPAAFTIKQHDTRPRFALGLTEVNQTTGVTQPVDLTNATSARLCAKDAAGTVVFASVLAISSTKTDGILTYTPVAGDTAVVDTFRLEVEVTWNDGGIETYPNDGYFSMTVFPDLSVP